MQYVNQEVGVPRQNRLLALLRESEWGRIGANLQPVKLALGEVVYESGGALEYVYFPTTAIVSLLHVLADGASAEIAVVGNDGVVGVPAFMGGGATPGRAAVQSEGWAYRLKAGILTAEFTRGGEMQRILLRYTQALIAQTAQTAVCNRYHSIEQQLCRRLLLSLDRLPSTELRMTHELIANMLGVRREGVTEAAGQLQTAGLIRYKREHISVVDRRGLEARCCECFAIVKTETIRLFPQRIEHAFVTTAADHAMHGPVDGLRRSAATNVRSAPPAFHVARATRESMLSPHPHRVIASPE